MRCSLAPYGRDIEPTCKELAYEFSNAVSLCCLLHAHGAPNKRPDMRRVFWEPQTREEVHSNVAYALRLAAANGIPCVFTVESWCCRHPPQPPPDCILLLLHEIARRWGDRPPPTAGEPTIITELVYRDSPRVEAAEQVAEQRDQPLERVRRARLPVYTSARGVPVPPSLPSARWHSDAGKVTAAAATRAKGRKATTAAQGINATLAPTPAEPDVRPGTFP